MNPRLYVKLRWKIFGPFEEGEPEMPTFTRLPTRGMLLVGEIVSDNPEGLICYDRHTSEVFQDVVSEEGRVFCPSEGERMFCPSEWAQPPPDRIWDKVSPRYPPHKVDPGGDDVLIMSAKHDNMEFRGTAFEQRYNSFCDGGKCPLIKELAKREALMWGKYKEFVHFKEPYPSGYQGVHGDFGCLTDNPYSPLVGAAMSPDGIFNVHDKNNPTHLLEVG